MIKVCAMIKETVFHAMRYVVSMIWSIQCLNPLMPVPTLQDNEDCSADEFDSTDILEQVRCLIALSKFNT